MADARLMARIHRVRTLQLALARADEARAAAAVETERQLTRRVAELAAAVAPVSGSAAALMARAHYRDKLAQSAVAADTRLARAQFEHRRRTEAMQDARRDEAAAEKLFHRARGEATARETRALEDLPQRSRKRHDPC